MGKTLTVCGQEGRQPWKPLRPRRLQEEEVEDLAVGIGSRKEEREVDPEEIHRQGFLRSKR